MWFQREPVAAKGSRSYLLLLWLWWGWRSKRPLRRYWLPCRCTGPRVPRKHRLWWAWHSSSSHRNETPRSWWARLAAGCGTSLSRASAGRTHMHESGPPPRVAQCSLWVAGWKLAFGRWKVSLHWWGWWRYAIETQQDCPLFVFALKRSTFIDFVCFIWLTFSPVSTTLLIFSLNPFCVVETLHITMCHTAMWLIITVIFCQASYGGVWVSGLKRLTLRWRQTPFALCKLMYVIHYNHNNVKNSGLYPERGSGISLSSFVTYLKVNRNNKRHQKTIMNKNRIEPYFNQQRLCVTSKAWWLNLKHTARGSNSSSSQIEQTKKFNSSSVN